ncbi:Tn3 family transposase [Streptomyces sp. NPDC101237]|uniref:Tn3 family transposase n=1 Tax=Streptomyces sp. NPDC101237 TaxID=3366139 RepID=UPI00381C1BBE
MREAVDVRIPTIDLPELLLEVHAWTAFLNHFHHVSEAGSRAEHVIVSLAAVLVSEACNIGIQAMVSEDEPGHSRDQLFWVEQNYLRADAVADGTDDGAAYDFVEPVSGDAAHLRQGPGRLQGFRIVAGLGPVGGEVALTAEEAVAGHGRAQGPEYAMVLQIEKVDGQQQYLISAGQRLVRRDVIGVAIGLTIAVLAIPASLVRLAYQHRGRTGRALRPEAC